jgi:type IV pilus assembly protein PilC
MDKELSQKLKIKGSGLSFGGASIKEKVLFTRNLAIMLRSGLSINESLEILASQAKGGFKSAINNIIKIISAGSSIADSLALYPRFFSSFYIQTIKAGETSGNLENNLHQLATRMEKEREFRDKIKSAMFYPLVVLVLSIVVALTMSLVVLPKITPIFKGLKIKLPVATLFLIAFSDFMKSYGWLVVMGIIAATFILFWFSRLKFFHPLTHYIFYIFHLLRSSATVKIQQFSAKHWEF